MRLHAMTILTFKPFSVFGNELFLDIAIDSINSLRNNEEGLSRMELCSRTGYSDASAMESNTFWKNKLIVKARGYDCLDYIDEEIVRANVVSVSRTTSYGVLYT